MQIVNGVYHIVNGVHKNGLIPYKLNTDIDFIVLYVDY